MYRLTKVKSDAVDDKPDACRTKSIATGAGTCSSPLSAIARSCYSVAVSECKSCDPIRCPRAAIRRLSACLQSLPQCGTTIVSVPMGYYYCICPNAGALVPFALDWLLPFLFSDKMESFFLGETLKYLFLLFAEDDVIPLDKVCCATSSEYVPPPFLPHPFCPHPFCPPFLPTLSTPPFLPPPFLLRL